jgi:integrase/recombinase XerD
VSTNLVAADVLPALPAVQPPDEQLLNLWLHGRSPHTQRAYGADVARFLVGVRKPLTQVTLSDLQAFADSLTDLAPASCARALSSVKSFLSFGFRLGLLPVNAGAALRLPAVKNRLAERILPEETVITMIALEPKPRNKVLLRLLYVAGLRESELCGLTWRDCQERGDAGQVTVMGKGGKTRTILISPATWRELVVLQDDAGGRGGDDPVFRSQKNGHLDASQIRRIVAAAARRAGLDAKVSPHWLRHAHASHALDRGAPAHLVQETLGHASLATTSRYVHARPSDSSARYLAL